MSAMVSLPLTVVTTVTNCWMDVDTRADVTHETASELVLALADDGAGVLDAGVEDSTDDDGAGVELAGVEEAASDDGVEAALGVETIDEAWDVWAADENTTEEPAVEVGCA